MKAILALLLVTVLGSVAPLSFASEERDPKQFKGVELYSWPNSSGKWQFALLPGTNGLKSRRQVHDLKYRIKGVAALERRLAQLAPGESVAWITGMMDSTPPERATVEEILAVAAKAGVHIFVTHSDEPATKSARANDHVSRPSTAIE